MAEMNRRHIADPAYSKRLTIGMRRADDYIVIISASLSLSHFENGRFRECRVRGAPDRVIRVAARFRIPAGAASSS